MMDDMDIMYEKQKAKAMSEKVIKQYEHDERTMVLVFAQWCVNHDLDPIALYHEAYPQQQPNPLLTEVMGETVAKEESEEISIDIVLYVLQMFGNDDLAFVVQEKAAALPKKT